MSLVRHRVVYVFYMQDMLRKEICPSKTPFFVFLQDMAFLKTCPRCVLDGLCVLACVFNRFIYLLIYLSIVEDMFIFKT